MNTNLNIKRILIVMILSFSLVFSGCLSSSDQENVLTEESVESVVTVDGLEAKKLVEEGAILVDVRTKEEYDTKHIDGAIRITLDDLEVLAERTLEDKEQKIIVYCRSGRRSGVAADKLKELGYKQIYDLGAMSSWD